jgi:5'(3')-deoxyribonucleotidase
MKPGDLMIFKSGKVCLILTTPIKKFMAGYTVNILSNQKIYKVLEHKFDWCKEENIWKQK